MALTHLDIAPFLSLIIGRAPKNMQMAQLEIGARDVVHLYNPAKHIISVDLSAGTTESLAFTYQIETKPSWAIGAQPINIEHHLVVATRAHDTVALYVSEPRVKQHILSKLHEKGFKGCTPLHPLQFEAAFLGGGASTLYLSGTHSPVKYKPNSKTMYGQELGDALEPFTDQTFFYTAARSKSVLAGTATSVGYCPYDSTVWWKACADWAAYESRVTSLLDLLASVKALKTSKLPILATPVRDLSAVNSPFDMDVDLMQVDSLEDVDFAREIREWREKTRLSVSAMSGSTVTFEATVSPLGTVATGSVTLSKSAVGITSKLTSDAVPGHEKLTEVKTLKSLTRNPELFKMWFESGHVLARRQLFEMKFRDQEFDQFEWHDFSGFDVSREKPDPLPLSAIGTTDSLFCWVRSKWATSGLLLCDDRAGEAADFVWLDKLQKRVALMHVKGASSKSDERHVSVSAFEIVVGQAVKNLRQLGAGDLAAYLVSGTSPTNINLAWDVSRGVPLTRAKFITELQSVTASWERTIYVLQPHLREHRYLAARKDAASAAGRRFRLLDALLLSARASALGVGMGFIALAAK